LQVTSHVARDLLQNASYFNVVPKVVAEYVTNAIDSAGPGLAIRCEVTIKNDGISISDTSSGMTYEELSNFFQMHGENIQRKRGRTVR
jgi:DNA gyrase/topoisomerase IV subunit B